MWRVILYLRGNKPVAFDPVVTEDPCQMMRDRANKEFGNGAWSWDCADIVHNSGDITLKFFFVG